MKKVTVLPGFYLCIAMCVCILPVSWVIAWLIAAFIHELFHIAALYLCGYPVYAVRIGASGAKIESDLQPGLSMVFCAFAGPISGFLLLLLLQRFPRIALCGLVQSAGNLLPILPLDGGRGIYSILVKVFKVKTAEGIFQFIEAAALIGILGMGVYATLHWKLGIAPLVVVTVFLIRKKALAKKWSSEYNMGN